MPFFLVSGLLIVLALVALAHNYSSTSTRRITHRAYLSEVALDGCKSAIDEALADFVQRANVNDPLVARGEKLFTQIRALKGTDVLTYRYTPEHIQPPPGITLAVHPVDLAIEVTDHGDDGGGNSNGAGASTPSPGTGAVGGQPSPASVGGGGSAGGAGGLAPQAGSAPTGTGQPGAQRAPGAIVSGGGSATPPLSDDDIAKIQRTVREFLATGACTVHLDFVLQTKQRGFLAASTAATASSPVQSVTRRLEVRRLITLDAFAQPALAAAGFSPDLTDLNRVSPDGQAPLPQDGASTNTPSPAPATAGTPGGGEGGRGGGATSAPSSGTTTGEQPLFVHISPFDIVHLTDRDATPQLAPMHRPLPDLPPPDEVPERIFRATPRTDD